MPEISDRYVITLGQVYSVNLLAYVPMTQPGAAGGGAATIADGADVAQGSIADAAWVSGSGTVIALLKKIASSGASAGLTDTQLRASAVPVSLATAPTTPVTGTFWQTTQPVSLATAPTTAVTNAGLTNLDVALSTRTKPADQQHAIIDSGTTTVTQATGTNLHVVVDTAPTTAVTGTFFQATQPVSLASAPTTAVTNAGLTNIDVALSTRLKPADTLTAVTTVGTITNAVTVTPPTLTKGTQGATGFSVQELKDAGRINIAWTAIVTPAAVAETLATLTESRDGAATTTFSTKVITSAKMLRITSVSMQVENSLGASIQRAYLRMRVNTAGAVTTASPQQGVWAGQALGTVKSISAPLLEEFPDGFEVLGDGTKQIGFSVQAPDWVTASATLNVYLTIFGYEY